MDDFRCLDEVITVQSSWKMSSDMHRAALANQLMAMEKWTLTTLSFVSYSLPMTAPICSQNHNKSSFEKVEVRAERSVSPPPPL